MIEQQARDAVAAASQEAHAEAESKIQLVSEAMRVEYEQLLTTVRTELADKASELTAAHAQSQQLQEELLVQQDALARSRLDTGNEDAIAADQRRVAEANTRISELTRELELERSAARKAVADAEVARAEAAEMKAGVISWVQEKTHGRSHALLQGGHNTPHLLPPALSLSSHLMYSM